MIKRYDILNFKETWFYWLAVALLILVFVVSCDPAKSQEKSAACPNPISLGDAVERMSLRTISTPEFISLSDVQSFLNWYNKQPPVSDIQFDDTQVSHVFHGTLATPTMIPGMVFPRGTEMFEFYRVDHCSNLLPVRQKHWLGWLEFNKEAFNDAA